MSNNQDHLEKNNIQQIFIWLLKELRPHTNLGVEDLTASQMIAEIQKDSKISKDYISYFLRRTRENILNLEPTKKIPEDTVKSNTEEKSTAPAINPEFFTLKQSFPFVTNLYGILYVHHVNKEIYCISSDLSVIDHHFNQTVKLINRLIESNLSIDNIISTFAVVNTGSKCNLTIEKGNTTKVHDFPSLEKMLAFCLAESTIYLSLLDN